MKVIIDSSVLIDYARAKKGLLAQLTELNRRRILTLYIPTAVVAELWAGLSMSKKGNEKVMKLLLRQMKIIALTRQLAESSGRLRREGVVIGFADSIVAASALYLNAQLATGNKKHFERVKGLKLFEG